MASNTIKVSLVVDDNGSMQLTARSAKKVQEELKKIGIEAHKASASI